MRDYQTEGNSTVPEKLKHSSKGHKNANGSFASLNMSKWQVKIMLEAIEVH